MLKTSVMLIGELEFEDMFFGETKLDASLMPYPAVTMVFFLCFLIVMPIIIMNLLVGLAVDDIKAVQDNAVLSRLAMQVSLNLDVEKVLPDFFRRRLAVREQHIYPNRDKLRNRFSRFFQDSSTLKRISDAVVAGGNESEISQLTTRLEDVANKVKSLKENIKQMADDQAAVCKILYVMAKQQGVDIEIDDNEE